MDEWTRKVQATVRRWWWAIGSGFIAVLVGGCCPVVAYGPPPIITPVVLYGPPPTPAGALPSPAGELLSLLSVIAFAVVGLVWVGQHRVK